MFNCSLIYTNVTINVLSVFQFDRYNFLVDLLLGAEQPVLITGAPGVGKSSLIEVSKI